MNIKKILALGGLLLSQSVMAEVITYPWPATAPISNKYSVTIYQDCQPYTPKTLYSEPQLEQGPDGDGVTGLVEDRSMSFVPFAYTGKIAVEAKKLYGSAASRVEISPLSYGIVPEYFDGKTVRFSLPDNLNPAYISVNFISDDNKDAGNLGAVNVKNGLVLFGDKPEQGQPNLNAAGVVDFTKATRSEIENADLIYFPTGDHDLREKFGKVNGARGTDSRIFLQRNGQQIYLAPGAIVRGSINAQGKDNIKVSGRGMFTGEDFYWHYFQDPATVKGKTAFLNFMGSNNSTFEGFIIVNPTHHTMPSGNDSVIRNFKIIGWASNHDGVRPASNSLVEQVFIKTSDDLDYARDPHVFKDSVIWPMRNGAFGMLGWNNLGTGFTDYKNIRFIHTEWDIPAANKRNTGIIGSVLNQGVFQSNNTLENIYAEWGTGMLANISIQFKQKPDPVQNQPINGSWGEIKDFTFKNIIMESKFQNSGGTGVKNLIKGFQKDGAKAIIQDIDFINLVAGDTIVTNNNASRFFDIDPNTTNNINFYTQGNIYDINVTHSAGGRLSPAGNNLPTPSGMDRYINIIPDNGQRIANVIVDGKSIGQPQLVHFKNTKADHSVEVIFESGNVYFGEPLQCDEPEVNQKPSVGFIRPINNSEFKVGDNIAISASASDADGRVVRVEFYANDNLIGRDSRSPYNARLRNLANGITKLKAIAIDDKGDRTQVVINIKTPSVTIPDEPDLPTGDPVNINNLVVKNNACDLMALTWSDVPGADKYRVRRKLSTDSTFQNIGDVNPGVQKFTDNNNLLNNKDYIYMVRPMVDGKAVKISNQPKVNNKCD